MKKKTIREYKNRQQAEYNLNLKGCGNDSSILTFKGLKHTEEWKINNGKIMKDHGNFVTNNPSKKKNKKMG